MMRSIRGKPRNFKVLQDLYKSSDVITCFMQPPLEKVSQNDALQNVAGSRAAGRQGSSVA
jgi:hypothetical protein